MLGGPQLEGMVLPSGSIGSDRPEHGAGSGERTVPVAGSISQSVLQSKEWPNHGSVPSRATPPGLTRHRFMCTCDALLH
jgi:hypothetical protein